MLMDAHNDIILSQYFIPLPDSSVIKFAPFAFTSPDYYLEREETQSVIDSYEQYFLGSGDSEFRVCGTLDMKINL